MMALSSTSGGDVENRERLLKQQETRSWNEPIHRFIENCSVSHPKDLSREKFRRPGDFRIPVIFQSWMKAWPWPISVQASHLMPHLRFEKLNLQGLTKTRMVLELADRSISTPTGIAEDVFVKVGTFYFPADFVVVDYDADPRVPLILGRPFLRTARALIDVHGENMTLKHDDQSVIYKVVFGSSFSTCLTHLEKMLKRCEDTNLALNWEKSHFMVKEGIVLGHKISKSGIEVDRAKIDVIAKLPHPTTIKGVRSFLGHAGFYRRFIQNFSKIARPMTHLLEKETPFYFSKECIEAFNTLKKNLTEAPILIAPDWNEPPNYLNLWCEQSISRALGQSWGKRHEKHFRPIHYASKTNKWRRITVTYTTPEKEMFTAMVGTHRELPILP
ncbi:reverse transcriptase domain-containing protein [Tanacetum coccineum]|uniref:Reverse transcriptase domain-containing protein n=1 Tax=Tanacetum coccineum TaxID=301880 RepID=A0ABQ5HWH9_9ASTR